MPSTKASPLRSLPSIDQLLRTAVAAKLRESLGLQHLTAIARHVTEEMRTEIQCRGSNEHSKEALLKEAARRLGSLAERESQVGIRRVINATGVILHTNLGRAPLSASARDAVGREASGYCTLEYDALTGSRGKRAARAEELLVQLTGAEAALVVNNCASAALLILTVLAADGETIVSRGELVEIGGDFRVPEVMSNSGTRMIEVGSTNRTHLDDYRRALDNKTKVIMRVHPSNYRIVGFTDSPGLGELAKLAHDADVFLYEDAGSGVLVDLTQYGLGDEPVISESISAGADVVSFSGDKLLGASQAGLIVGRREIIDRLRTHSLYRALRADKLCLAALEATLDAHRRGALEEIPTLRMLGLSMESIENRARSIAGVVSGEPGFAGLTATVISGESAVGGGSGPNVHPLTALLALKHNTYSADELQEKLRISSPPVICRIAGGLVLIDPRTVDPQDEPDLIRALKSLGA
ncbi:MAG TPA: L-seryl-tRNA(Sec) selenium transferase [Pyrinomonadaceae bacterium]|nr:L-seryl-tRNA(Sec) selenium transferase [Pyrinomonadaceae bacterium]